MASITGGRRRGRASIVANLLGLGACAIATASCTNPTNLSYQAAAMEASEGGDLKTAISLAEKEVVRFSAPEQCSRTNSYNCGTLALAYSSLAEYQILNGNKMAGESSFASAKAALDWTNPANLASATGIVYRDVSEAFWKAGDRTRAIAVFNEGRAAGGDEWLLMCSAARVASQGPTAAP